MKGIRTIWLALATGMVVEGALCGLAVMFGRFGPCGPGNEITGLLFAVHLPGIQISEALLPQDSSIQLPAVITVTAALLSAVAFLVIGVVRRFFGRAETPAA
ncbi:MAG: hypothetical protein HY301_10710 [Verrucomicrobia bacterium]|nr:hypothetical protein [Verrucomicrobiota bacterium]